MKRKSIICCLIVLAMCLSILAACATDFDADTLQVTITNIELEHYQTTSTSTSYQLDRKVETYDAKGNPATIYVKWTIEDSNLITITENGDTVTVNIPDARVAAISYKLRATLTNANGKAYTKDDGTNYTAVFTREVPIEGNQDNNGDNDNQGNQGNNGDNDNQGGNNQGSTTPTEGNGTQNSPYTVAQVLQVGAALANNEFSATAVYVKGIVVAGATNNGSTPYQGSSGDWKLHIADTANGTTTLYVFFATPASSITSVAVGDTVTLYGFIEKYYDEVQMYGGGSSGKAMPQIVSLTPGSSGNQGNTGDNQGTGDNTGNDTATSATLSLIGTSTRTNYSTSQIVHSGNGITYTNDQASSKTPCYNTSDESWSTRAYGGSTIKITYTSPMTSIVITFDNGTYNDKQYMSGFDDMSVAGATIARNEDKLTITFSTPSTTFQSGELASQCRINSVTVYTGGTPDTGNQGGNSGNQGGDNNDTPSGSQSGTLNFNFVTNFSTYASGWTNQYGVQTVAATVLGVNANVSFEFSNASKQGSTISNMPVMASKNGAEQYVTATANGATISSVTFNLNEWVTGGGGAAKTFTTLTIEYSTDGNNWNATNAGLVNGTASQVSAYSTISYSNLPSGVVAVRLVIAGSEDASGNQQVGIQGCTLVLG